MPTYLDALRGINAYPVPPRTLSAIARRRGLDLDAEQTQDGLAGKPYMLCRADVLSWLAFAPDITQGGQSYSFTDDQREQFTQTAESIYGTLEQADPDMGVTYGYKGDRL